MHRLALRNTRSFSATNLLSSIVSLRNESLGRRQQQIRPLAIGWVEFVNERYDPRSGNYKSEDVEMTVSRIQEERGSSGQPILMAPKNQRNARHVKPTTYRKELANKIAYQRKRQEVTDLIKYIQFTKDHKDKDNW